MIRKSLRSWLSQSFRRVLYQRGHRFTSESWRRPVIVFSPHQDDETLGCGGTIIKRVEGGAAVQVVFMTDGHQSHKHLMAPEELSLIRRKEAVSACAVLGVPESSITFLDMPDGHLIEHLENATERVRAILSQSPATDLFVPYRGEPTPDHTATHAIIQKALANQGRSYSVYEYPVWFWHHWPWVSLIQPNRQASWFVLKNTLLALFGLRLLLDFRYAVPVNDVRARKWTALLEHKSQMTQLVDDLEWLTLYDVSKGEFLNNLTQGYEMFCKTVYHAAEEIQ